MQLYKAFTFYAMTPTFTMMKYLLKRAEFCWSRCNAPVIIDWLPLNKTNPPPYQLSEGETAKVALRESCWECTLEKAHARNRGGNLYFLRSLHTSSSYKESTGIFKTIVPLMLFMIMKYLQPVCF